MFRLPCHEGDHTITDPHILPSPFLCIWWSLWPLNHLSILLRTIFNRNPDSPLSFWGFLLLLNSIHQGLDMCRRPSHVSYCSWIGRHICFRFHTGECLHCSCHHARHLWIPSRLDQNWQSRIKISISRDAKVWSLCFQEGCRQLHKSASRYIFFRPWRIP